MNDQRKHIVTGQQPILTDQQLVSCILRGEIRYFRVIMDRSERLVAQIVFKMVASREDRKDISQDIYLKAYNALGSFNFRSKLTTWIGQIAYNTCLNYIQKKKLLLIENHPDDREDAQTSTYEGYGVQKEPEMLLSAKELSGILNEEVDKLPVIYRTLITLYHREELSYAEIGEITGLPDGTIKNYLFRARKTLKQNLLSKYTKEEL